MVTGVCVTEHIRDRRAHPTADWTLHAHADAHVWTWTAAVAIVAELRRGLLLRERARLLVSPSDRISPVFQALAKAPLAWDRIDVGLVDERWLRPDDPDSHAAAVHRHLLVDQASRARLEPLTLAGRRLEDAVAIANAHARQPADVILLSMGDDGHVAALFPDSPDFPRALVSKQDYMSLDAAYSPGAGPWTRRITATPLGLSRAQFRILMLRGEAQRRHFENAITAPDAFSSSLAALRLQDGAPLQTHWCP